MSLKQIKNQIRSVNKIHQVTKAMEAVSAVKMRKGQQQALQGRPYARASLSILKRVSGSMEVLDHPLAEKRDVKNVCIVVVAAERGLAGSFNSNIFRRVEKTANSFEKESIQMITLGKKATEYFRKRDYHIYESVDDVPDEVSENWLSDVNKKIVSGYENNDFDEVLLVYTNFVSTFEQRTVARRMLPISLENIEEIVDGIVPDSGRYSEAKSASLAETDESLYRVEPSDQAVLSELLPVLLSVELYHGMLESKASEHSARMVAMKSASDKASDLSREFKLQYNQERQAQITNEVSEIIGGIETNAS